MATDVATLKLELDGNGFIATAGRAGASLNTLGVVSDKVQGKVKAFSMNSAFALSSLASSGARDITSVLRSLSSLGFAFGAGVGTVTLAISAIADAWSEARRKVKEEQDKMQADLQSFIGKYQQAGVDIALARVRAERDAILGKAPRFEATRSTTNAADMARNIRAVSPDLTAAEVARIKVLDAEMAKLQERQREINNEAARQEQKKSIEAATKAAKEYIDAEAERIAYLHDLEMDADAAEINAIRERNAEEDAFARDEEERIQYLHDLVMDSEAREIDAIRERAAEEKRVAEQKKQFWIGAGLGVLGAMSPALGNAASAGIAGFGAAGPLGAVFGVVNSLVGSIFNMGKASREAARANAEWLVQMKLLAGEMTQAEVDASRLASQFAPQRRRHEIALMQAQQDAMFATSAFMKDYYAKRIADEKAAIAELDALQGKINENRAEEIAAISAVLIEDARVRILRATGRTEEADAMAQALANERELAEARKNNASETALATIAEAQRVEAIQRSMEKIKATIAGFEATIGNLQDFRNSLLLSDSAGLSPTAKLAEARRQYEEVLALTQGDDITKAQEAAGRLPASAQALLDASRAVNASGSGFQSDLAKVLADNAAVIQRFQDLKTIEELMLDELKRIQENTAWGKRLTEEIITPIGTIETDTGGRGRGRITPTGDAAGEAMVNVSADGFSRLVKQLETTNAKLDALTNATKRSGEQALAVAR